MEKGRIQVYAKKCIKLCKSNCYRVEFSVAQMEVRILLNATYIGRVTVLEHLHYGHKNGQLIPVYKV